MQFSVTLPLRAAEMLEELVGIGLHGATRGEVARSLILSRLETLVGNNVIALRPTRTEHVDHEEPPQAEIPE